MDLVDDRGRPGQPPDHQRRQLPAQVHRRGPDVEQQVARGGHGPVPIAVERPERVQLGRPRPGEEAVPRLRPHPRHDGQPAFERTEGDRPGQSRQVGEEVRDHGLATLVDRQDEDDGARRQRGEHGLGDRLLHHGLGVLRHARHQSSSDSPVLTPISPRDAPGAVADERSGEGGSGRWAFGGSTGSDGRWPVRTGRAAQAPRPAATAASRA